MLIGQNAFLPWDASATAAQQARLGAILGAAARGDYPIRVAVIASQSDLGSVTALWRRPELYARFLDQELSLAYKGAVVIVMPNGIGLASAMPLSAAERSAAAAASTGAAIARPHLTPVAESVVEKLAAASGHPLPPGVIAAPATASGANPNSTGTIAYLALVLGAVLIAAAWGASLRARPPQALARRRASG